MRRERRKPTRREWAQITSSRPVVRRVIRDAAPWKAREPMDAGEAPLFGVVLTGNDEVNKASEGEEPSR